MAALITAIGGAFFGGAQLAGGAQAQPTVYVTVTDSAPAPAASDVAAASQGIAGPDGAPPSSVNLSSLTPVQTSVDGFTSDSPQQIGTTTYSDGIGFSCSSGSDSYYGYNTLVYEVAGHQTLTATIGIPSNAANASGNSATIKFFKDGSSTQLGTTLTVALDNPAHVTLNLQGSSQLEIYCIAANQDGSNGDDINVAIGNATLSPS